MIINSVAAKLCAEDLVPPSVLQRVADHSRFLRDVGRYVAMDDDDLLRATESCLKNLEHLDDEIASPDADLRIVLVPALWERLRPGSRDALRRITSTLAEYDPDPTRPSFWEQSRLWSAERGSRLREAADNLRQRVGAASALDARALVEQTRFAIAGSRASDRWPPDYSVYEPGFTYRLVPVIAWRVLVRNRAAPDVVHDRSGN